MNYYGCRYSLQIVKYLLKAHTTCVRDELLHWTAQQLVHRCLQVQQLLHWTALQSAKIVALESATIVALDRFVIVTATCQQW